jgi:hypothetical protein
MDAFVWQRQAPKHSSNLRGGTTLPRLRYGKAAGVDGILGHVMLDLLTDKNIQQQETPFMQKFQYQGLAADFLSAAQEYMLDWQWLLVLPLACINESGVCGCDKGAGGLRRENTPSSKAASPPDIKPPSRVGGR